MKCPICQTENRKGRKFYSKCGKTLKINCASGQAVNELGEDYCGECGQLPKEQAAKSSKSRSKKTKTIEPVPFVNGRYQIKKLIGEGGKRRYTLSTKPCWTGISHTP